MGPCPGSVTKVVCLVAQLCWAFHGVDGHHGMAHPRSAEAKPSGHGSRVIPAVLIQRNFAKQRGMSPGSLLADNPHTPAVRWRRQLYRGATETPLAASDAGTPALPLAFPSSLSGIVCGVISQDQGASVTKYQIRLPVRHSCRAEPW